MDCIVTKVVWALMPAVLCCGVVEAEGLEIDMAENYGQSVRASADGFPLIVLRGTHEERGRAHGFLAAREIVRTLDAMAGAINAGGDSGEGPTPWAAACEMVDRFAFPGRFLTEVGGMLAGIEEALPDAADRTLNATGAPLTLEDLKVLQCGDVLELMQCSQFSAWGHLTPGGEIVIGRNWDYPPIFPFDTYMIVAVDPAEPGLQRTIDALWFGMIGAGFACLNESGVYISGNDGGREDASAVEDPCPAALAIRMAAETAAPADPLGPVREMIDQRTALHLLFHIVAPPASPGAAARAWIFEHRPGAEGHFEERLRGTGQTFPEAVFVTNTPMIGKSDDESGCERYEKIRDALSAAGGDNRIDLAAAKAILDSVSVSERDRTTQYSGVIFPQGMEMHIAVSRAPAQSATKQPYTRVRWADVWAVE